MKTTFIYNGSTKENHFKMISLGRMKDKHWQELRERAAIAAMQGLLCRPIIEGVDPNPSKEQIVEYSLELADELIKQLKTKQLEL